MAAKNTKKDVSSSSYIRQGLDHINQGITIFDAELKLVTWNKQFLDLLEFPDELAYPGAPFSSFMRHNAEKGEYGDGDIELLVRERVETAKKFEKHKLERVRPDGTVIEVTGSPLPGGGFVSIYTDITVQKRREEALEKRAMERTEALRLSEARLQLLANEVPAGIAHIDQNMHILFANKRFARAYDMTPEEIVGRDCHDVLHPRTMSESSRFFEQARRGAVVDFELNIEMPNEKVRDVRTFLRPDQTSEGEITAFYILSVDVTSKKAATSALLRSQKMDALGRLSSGISHDFNNLLTIILGNLAPLEDLLTDDPLRHEYLAPAIAAARRGSNLTRRLLNLARRQPINPEAIEADKLIHDLLELLRNSMPESISLTRDLNEPGLSVFVDGSELETALLNIIVNARDAIENKGMIGVSTTRYDLTPVEADLLKIAAGPYMRIEISDTGKGISPEETERIFEPFQTSKGETGGSGLGLAMVYGFVQQSNGAIWVESELGTGTRFIIILPISNAQPIAKPEAPPLDPVERVKDGKKLILLVEDDEEVRRVIRRQLVALGFSTIEAETADAALDLISMVDTIECVLTDVAMPGKIDGCDLALAIHEVRPDIQTVLMSGNMDGGRAAVRAPNDTPLLRKPFSNEELIASLNPQRLAPLAERKTGT